LIRSFRIRDRGAHRRRDATGEPRYEVLETVHDERLGLMPPATERDIAFCLPFPRIYAERERDAADAECARLNDAWRASDPHHPRFDASVSFDFPTPPEQPAVARSWKCDRCGAQVAAALPLYEGTQRVICACGAKYSARADWPNGHVVDRVE